MRFGSAGSVDTVGGLRIAYLVNQYPKVSHTFIRREILALEQGGIQVDRLALRGWDAELADPQDVAERERTRYVLRDGLWPLAGVALRAAVTRPRRFLAALRLAVSMSRNAERPLPYHLIYLAHACRLRVWLAQTGATHLHAHFATNSAEIAMLLQELGGPTYSFTVHGAYEVNNALFLGMARKVARARFVVAISDYTRAQLLRNVPPGQWSKIAIVHCGLDGAFLKQEATALPDPPQFLCIGRLSAEKGHLVLLDAFARVAQTCPGSQLVLAGDGELRSEIEARIAALGLQESVRITGWLGSEQVRDEIELATIVVQPSFQEGLPVVIMEAMALGRPVISTYVGAIPELVRPEVTGWLVPAGSVDDLERALAESLATPADMLQKMGEAATRRVRQRHDVTYEVAKLEALFRQ